MRDKPTFCPWPPSSLRALGPVVALGLGALCALLLLDRHAAHGYDATWYAIVDGERTEVTRTTEHRVQFPNVHRALSRVVQGWPFRRLEIPAGLPVIDAALRARLEVPRGPRRRLHAEAVESADLWVDGARLGPGDLLDAGPHDLYIHWRARPAPHGGTSGQLRRSDTASFALRWTTESGDAEGVPASALTPADGAWTTDRWLVWGGALPLLALLLGWALFAASGRRPEERLRRWGALAAASVVVLAIGYRAVDYDVMPEYRENADELFAMWNGWSLLHDGTTRGWTSWPDAYHEGGEVTATQAFGQAVGESLPTVSPYFDHPPLMHLLVGAAVHLGGAESWLETKLAHARWVPIGLAGLCCLLVMAITRRIAPRGPAPLFAGLLYAVLPTVVLQTRVVKEEALLTVLVTAMIYFFLRFRDDGRAQRDLVLAALCAGAAVLTKIPALALTPALVILVLSEEEAGRDAIVAGAVALLAAALWPLMGALIDWPTFVRVAEEQLGRPAHWNLFPRWFDTSLVNHNAVGRGFVIFLWIAFAAAVFRRGVRAVAPVVVPLVAYLVAIALGAGNWMFGWYPVPLYPLLAVGAGLFLARLWRSPDLLSGALFVALPLMYALNFTLDVEVARARASWPALRLGVTAFVGLALLPYAAAQVWPARPGAAAAARVATAAGLMALVLSSWHFVANYDVLYETHHGFDRLEFFTP